MSLLAPIRPLNILLVEDNQSDAVLVTQALKKTAALPPAISRAETLAAALRLLSEQSFDVVLLDLSLNDATGFNGLLSIQNIAPKVPVILLTAHDSEETALAAVLHGAQDYLFKNEADGKTIQRAIRYAIQRKAFESILTTHANYDALTGLANRMLFENRLDMAISRRSRTGEGIGVFFLDLNRFKRVNDELGHAFGDQLLQHTAQRLSECVRPYDTVARFGGDEFALIIDSVKQAQDCETIAHKIIDAVARPFQLTGRIANVGVSIGIALCLAAGRSTRAELVRNADAAMYRAKQTPESNFKFDDDDKLHIVHN